MIEPHLHDNSCNSQMQLQAVPTHAAAVALEQKL